MLSTLLAINWEPELRGILVVIIGGVVWFGSIYLILGTNVGARLGFLLVLAGLTGWLTIMGFQWMIYGIGMQGPLPTWVEVPGRTVLSSPAALVQARVLDDFDATTVADLDAADTAAAVATAFEDEGWVRLEESSSAFGQAVASAQTLIEHEGIYDAGRFTAVNVFDTGGERSPKIGESIDFLAFRHAPHYVVVEFVPFEPTRTELGRAPASNVIDDSQPRQYVHMVRDLGSRRQPALVLMVGSGAMFGACCYLLHRRDRTVAANLAAPATVAAAD